MLTKSEQEEALIALLRCPQCGGPLAAPAPAGAAPLAICRDCGARYPQTDGIWRLLTEADTQRYAPFLAQYRALRQREGWERETPSKRATVLEPRTETTRSTSPRSS